ncbi:Ubiquitin carboxyl-terminal hydrolase isozyme L3 [Apophysomyces ossiformis]|uniref:Ubiquitin carboxyl-terminal hydrolase n=1 Tax=Apophysomyces ossiformis TaxID=679940 RepID=A0A8H7BWX4_9FUNG|nr:Ubiquitin carboxyl-terminal hydrolase isozyme L3 [Apophysomyces ossiformis]
MNVFVGFEPELLAMIPQPVKAIIFLYPITEGYKDFKQQEEDHLKAHGQMISPKVAFFKQTISNACGMMALLHTLTNNQDIVGPGLFRQIMEDTRHMTSDARVNYLERCQALANVHAASAQEGQTQPPNLDEQLTDHFICFVEIDQHLYELDGIKSFPINHGKCVDLIQGAAKIMKQFIQREPGLNNFSAIALSKVQ